MAMTSESSNKRTPGSLPGFGRRAISASNLSRASWLRDGQMLPCVIEPEVEGVLLWAWAERNREFIEHSLLKYGALLFRGFNVRTPAEFEKCARAIYPELLHYSERTTPRAQVSDWIYTSTEYPANESIAMHNELSYANRWPAKLWFFCQVAAAQGGETPIADVRRIYERISPEIRERFSRKGWMLVRNFGDGLGLQWKDAFGTAERTEAENYCRRSAISFEWRDETRLRTSQVRPAIVKHPHTHELSWFNHVAFYHVSSLSPALRESLLSQFAERDLPFNTYYGDGSAIEESIIEEIRHAYLQETIEFCWREGDVLLLDNMLVAHGRKPFSGPRKILVAMGESIDRSELQTLE
jgi:alpha-ketoglutarate-dependent taurine dioxygenase